ncbi:MAG TPA: Xaa-Pro aminopeptidase, partial [Chromatiales bacterium]|nr:Xaa-Pro aminopeptidase [Chromatiales bacterium]
MSQREFERRRRGLLRMMPADSIAILPAARERLRNRDVHYPFRQHSDFLYLTGFPEPDAVAVLAPGRKQGQYILFCRERDPKKEVWEGRRAGPEGA